MNMKLQPDNSLLWTIAAVIISAGTLLLCSLISYFILLDYQPSGDEYNYLYQAKIFAKGLLAIPAEPWQQSIRETYMLTYNNHVFAKYPPGWPAVLSLGVHLDITGIINPLLSAATVIALYFAIREATSAKTAALTLTILITNVYFLVYGSSYFAQPLVLFIWATTMRCLVACYFRGNSKWYLSTGALIALLWFVRPLDAFCLLTTVLTAILAYTRRSGTTPLAEFYKSKHLIRPVCLIAIPSIISVFLLYTYNWIVSDCFCIATYRIWDFEFRVHNPRVEGLWSNIQDVAVSYYNSFIKHQLQLFFVYFAPIAGWPFFLLLVLGAYCTPRYLLLPCVLSIVLIVLLYNFHHTTGWPVYGARYWYPLIAPISLLIAYGINYLVINIPKPMGIVIYMAIIAAQLTNQSPYINKYSNESRLTLRLLETRQHIMEKCPSKSVVLINAKKDRSVNALQMCRNMFVDGIPEYIFICEETHANSALAALPDYTKCVINEWPQKLIQ